MIVIPGRIPISIHPIFWLLAALIGWLYSQHIVGMFIWIGIIFVSVLVHEFGHALTAVGFKQRARIHLVALGGLTAYEGGKLKFWQQFLIVLNGPLFGFGLFILASYLLTFSWNPIITISLKWTQMANLFWTIANLLPVPPLDGGQLLRIVFEGIWGVKGFRASFLTGSIIALLLALYFMVIDAFLLGAIFFLFAFQSFNTWRQSRFMNAGDADDEAKLLVATGEEAFKAGKHEEAKSLFQQVLAKGKEGLLSFTATQYLGFLEEMGGNHAEAYRLLSSIRPHLSDEGLLLLHKLAFLQQDFALVAEISSTCYAAFSTQEVALRNARSFAYLKNPSAAGGWLQTAWEYGGVHLETLLKEEPFSAIKDNPEFISFVEKLS